MGVQVNMGALMTCSMTAIILSCLYSHTTMAQRKGWQLADPLQAEAGARQLLRANQGQTKGQGSMAASSGISLTGLRPYWIERESQANDVDLHSIAILTGMALPVSNSTLLRPCTAPDNRASRASKSSVWRTDNVPIIGLVDPCMKPAMWCCCDLCIPLYNALAAVNISSNRCPAASRTAVLQPQPADEAASGHHDAQLLLVAMKASWLSIAAGPNMAGKSTILRSTAAAALLAQCGLFVPADSASVPALDGIELRTFHGDAPAEGKSAWAMEMQEMG